MRFPLAAAETVVGLDVGDGLVTAAQAEVKGDGRVRLTNAGWEELTPDSAPEATAAAIRRLWKKHRFTTYTVCSCLRSPAVVLRHFRYPDLTVKELESALWLEAEEILQMPRDEAALHWHVFSGASEAGTGGKGVEGILVAAPWKEVAAHQKVLEAAGLFPVVVDVGCMAIGNLYLALKGATLAGPVCVVNLAGKCADIAVLFEGGGIFPRELFLRAGTWESGADHLAASVGDALKYCEFKLHRPPVKKMVLAGDAPADAEWRAKVGAGAGVPVEAWDPVAETPLKSWRALRLFAGHRERAAAMAVAMGLALRR